MLNRNSFKSYFNIVCSICFLLLSAFPVCSQTGKSYYFHKLNINNGLSQNTVNAILQDKSGFLWFGTKDGLNRYDGISFKVFKDNRIHKRGLKHGFVTTLFESDNGDIWVGTDAGVYIFDPNTEHFSFFSLKAQNGRPINQTVNKIGKGKNGTILLAVDGLGLFTYNDKTKSLYNYSFSERGSVRDFLLDRQGRTWVSFYRGLYVTDGNLKSLRPYQLFNGEQPFKNESITTLHFAKGSKLYIGSEKNGMSAFDLITQKLERLPLSYGSKTPIYVRCIYPYSDDELWIGTETGIYIYDIKNKTSKHLENRKSDPSSISDNAIYALYKDREGGMWIGTYFGGISFYPKQNAYFEKYYPTNDLKSLQGQRVREICKGENEDLWIGTEDAGLFRFNNATKEFKHLPASAKFTNIHGLCMDGNQLWIGTFSKGVHVLNTNTGAIKSYMAEDEPKTIEDNYVFSILKSSQGDIYLGTSRSLMLYNKRQDKFERIAAVGNNLIYDIKEDSRRNIWVATYTNGVYQLDYQTKKWSHFNASEKKGSLPHGKILSIFEDSQQQIWITTQGRGFGKFDVKTKTFIPYKDQYNTNYDVVYQIVEDEDGFFWLTTNSGLVRLQPKDGSNKIYTVASGLLSNQFNYKSSYKAENGKIFLGCIDGLIAFNPDTFTENKYVPPVYITDFLLFGKPIDVGEESSPLKKSIIYSDAITLNHNQNHFSLRIAALSYQAPEINALQYKLDGIGEDWKSVTETPLVSYANLAPGKYTFRVRGSNNDQNWNRKEKTLQITIKPPFYLATWAYFFYFIFFASACYAVFRFLKNRQLLRRKWFMQEMQQQKEREVHDAKISFFTNVTHEIRTPLTLIKGPLEHIINKNTIEDKDTVDDLQIMKQNTNRLLDLTNQLLDFQKTEREGFSLRYANQNISFLVEEMHQSFLPLIKEYGRTFVVTGTDNEFYASIDKEAFLKIVSNLLSNAIKYAKQFIHVSLTVHAEQSAFEIRVQSDGDQIAVADREEIFKAFTRLNHNETSKALGTGIGLHLARSLAELHNGTLSILPDDQYNVFSLYMPFAVQTEAQELVDRAVGEEELEEANKMHTILLVEDNTDMRRFVQKVIPQHYKVLVAENGEAALELLKTNFVALVISDIMMPIMDGIELCQIIKSDINYSHVPIILLTAKTNLQSKIEGMDVGADAYIEKPFSEAYLLAVVANLINSREKLKEAFMTNPLVLSNTMLHTAADKEFMRVLRNTMVQNIGNADLKMEDIAESLNMSRASFYRKIKGLLDLKPNEYLRLERLKMAAHLIKENKYPIGEICYMVGFNSPSYFSKCFQEQFGMLPKDYK